MTAPLSRLIDEACERAIAERTEGQFRRLQRRVREVLEDDSYLSEDEIKAVLALLDPAKERMSEAIRSRTIEKARVTLMDWAW